MTQPNVLLVDDLKENFEIARLVLDKICRVHWAESGQEAIDLLLDGKQVDLILLDIMMPVMDGYETCKRLKSEPLTKDIPVIFITALGEVRDDQYGFDLGAADYVIRPFSPGVLRSRVITHLSLQEKTKALEIKASQNDSPFHKQKMELIECLAIAIDSRGVKEKHHVTRVADYACILAKAAGVPEADLDAYRVAALLHDLGKICLPESFRKDNSPVSDTHETEMHTRAASLLLNKHSGDLFTIIKGACLSHHERWDGSGYPNGLKGTEIPLSARIVSIADAFDRLTKDNFGKKIRSVEEGLDFIENRAGDFFDPMLVPLLRKHVDEIYRVYNDDNLKSTKTENGLLNYLRNFKIG